MDIRPPDSGLVPHRMGKASIRPHVLVAEDQEPLAGNLEMMLRLSGFEVTTVSDGPAALKAARTQGVDAVVLDVMLPGLDGFEVCRMLRADRSTSRMVIVMLTALDDTGSKLEGLQGGADDYLVKPVTSKELIARLRSRLGHRTANAEEVRRQRLQAIGEISAAVCHEINSPLTAAIGTLDLLLMSGQAAGLEAELRRCLDNLLRIAETLGKLGTVDDRTVPYLGSCRMLDLKVM